MRTSLAFVLLSLAFFFVLDAARAGHQAARRAGVLPLEINDKFQFRKIKQTFFDADPVPRTQSEPVLFERQRLVWGAVDRYQLDKRYGNYYTFFWRTSGSATSPSVLNIARPPSAIMSWPWNATILRRKALTCRSSTPRATNIWSPAESLPGGFF